MIYPLVLIAASAAVASAQAVTYNSTTGVFTCPASNPNGAYCADNSGTTNIIIRCTDGIGHPGNCNDNLSGTFPFGLSYAPCWQTSATSGDAACSKNCIVYGGSGNANGTFPVPGCSPTTTQSIASSTTVASSTSTSVSITSSPTPTSSASGSTTITSTGTTTCVTGGTTTTVTFTTTYCPESTFSTITIPLSTESSAAPSNGTVSTSVTYPSNGTSSTAGPGATTTGSATATPVGPTTTTSTSATFTGAAMSNSAGAGLAAVGLFIAYFL